MSVDTCVYQRRFTVDVLTVWVGVVEEEESAGGNMAISCSPIGVVCAFENRLRLQNLYCETGY